MNYLKKNYLTPINWDFSPGVKHFEAYFKELTWVMDKIVAATNQGNPKMEQRAIKMAKTNKSRW